MKKLLPILLSAALALSGCSAPDASAPADSAAAPAETTEATEPTATAAEAAFPVGTLYRMPSVFAGDGGFNTGEGYYEILTAPPNHDGGLIVKTDYGTMAQAPVCQVPGCTHDSEACPAYLPSAYGLTIFVIDGEVYIYHVRSTSQTDSPADSQTDEELAARLAQEGLSDEDIQSALNSRALDREPSFIDVISADGLSRRRLLSIGPEEDWYYRLSYCDGTALYGSRSMFLSDQPDAGIRLELTTGQVDTFPMAANERIVGAMENRLLTCRIVTDEPLPATQDETYWVIRNNGQMEYDLLDPATGSRVQLYSTSLREPFGYFAAYQGRLYGMAQALDSDGNPVEQWVECLDPQTGETTAFTDPLPGASGWIPPQDTDLMPVGSGRETRCIWLNEGTLDDTDYRLDLETGEVYATPRQYNGDGQPTSLAVLAETNDGRWLVGWDSHSDAGSGDSALRQDYGLIDPAAFLQGSEEYEYVDMWP